MKQFALLTLISTLLALTAASPHHLPQTKKCKPRPATGSPSPTPQADPGTAGQPSPTGSPGASPNGGSPGPANGVLNVPTTSCPVGATASTTKNTGPNGCQDFLNCRFTSAEGWHPEMVKVSDLVYIPLAQALQSPDSPFQLCKDFLPLFQQHAQEYGLPDILLAAFAMQESTCNPDAVGSAQEQGLMQIKLDKCDGAPDGNCKNPDFNIMAGAKFFADLLQQSGGNIVLAVGSYNGFSIGLTLDEANANAAQSCANQINYNYMFEFFNGWLQNIDAHNPSNHLGDYDDPHLC